MALAVCVAAACGSDDDGGTADGGGGTAPTGGEQRTIRIAVGEEISSLDPQLTDNGVVFQVLFSNAFEPLVKWSGGEESEIVPSLATEWEQVDDRTWRFTLADGVEFQNGEPFDADAAVFSLERVMDPATASELAERLSTVESVTAVDESTIEIVTTEPDPILLARLVSIMMVPPELTASGADALSNEPVGTGPYEITNGAIDQVSMQAWDGYHGEAPEVQQVEFTVLSEDAARVAALNAGEVDIIYNLPPVDYDRVPKASSVAGMEVHLARLNGIGGLTQDERVREAICLAVDGETIREALWGDLAEPANGQPFPAHLQGSNDGVTGCEFDPDAARALLDEAGATGETIRLVAPAGRWPQIPEMAEAMAANLTEVGLEVDFSTVDYQTFLDSWVEPQPDAPELMFAGGSSEDYRSPMQTYLNYAHEEGIVNTFPVEEYPEIQELVYAAQVEPDPEEHIAMLEEISQLLSETHLLLPLYVPKYTFGSAENIEWELRSDNRIELSTLRITS